VKIYEYNEGLTLEEQRDGAYWERNMLVLYLAKFIKDLNEITGETGESCGWYYDTDNNWEGWKRVISIGGDITYHIPDDFDVGELPEIKPNWDGHTTKEKYQRMMCYCGCKID